MPAAHITLIHSIPQLLCVMIQNPSKNMEIYHSPQPSAVLGKVLNALEEIEVEGAGLKFRERIRQQRERIVRVMQVGNMPKKVTTSHTIHRDHAVFSNAKVFFTSTCFW